MFSFLSFFFFISPRDLRAPSADRHETLPRDRKCVLFYNPGLKIGGEEGCPQKIFGRQKRAKFWTILDNFRLRSRISPERMEISKIERHDRQRFLCIRRKKSGVLWSTNNTVLQVDSAPHKSNFSEDHISAPMGCWI